MAVLAGPAQLQPDVTAAISARISDLMGQCRAIGFGAEVNVEVGVDFESPLLDVNIDLWDKRWFTHQTCHHPYHDLILRSKSPHLQQV